MWFGKKYLSVLLNEYFCKKKCYNRYKTLKEFRKDSFYCNEEKEKINFKNKISFFSALIQVFFLKRSSNGNKKGSCEGVGYIDQLRRAKNEV